MADYPASIKTWVDRSTVDHVMPEDINTIYDEITALETELGLAPKGTSSDLVTRLSRSLDGLGNIDFVSSTNLTISSGAITPTQNYHTVDTEASAGTDDLVTINATNATDGFVLVLRQNNSGRDVTIKHGSGNILCPGAVDIAMSLSSSIMLLVYDAGNTVWNVLGVLNSALVNASNTYTLEQVYGASIRYPYTNPTTDTTLGATSYMVDCNAVGGAFTITLPTAVGINGRIYNIRKSDSSNNIITVDANGTETINGSLTITISTQYTNITIMSNGANWIII